MQNAIDNIVNDLPFLVKEHWWTNVLDYNFSLIYLYSLDNQKGKIVSVRVPDLSNKGTKQFREITVQ